MIYKWEDLQELGHSWDNLLLGNGFSCNIWKNYSYTSLLEYSEDCSIDPILEDSVLDIFDSLETTNFEEVLKTLLTTAIVKESLGEDTEQVLDLYENVRNNLFNTVYATHIPYRKLKKKILGKELTRFRKVFTTCYDLIPYWSVYNTIADAKQKDFFWGGCQFNPRNVALFYPNSVTAFYYMHGALHLKTNLAGETNKILGASNDLPKMDSYEFRKLSTELPLFITEGTSVYKINKIESNSYLNFCYTEFSKIKNGLVVIGQGLDPNYDQHLIDAIVENENLDHVALSIYSGLKDKQKESIKKFFEARLFRKNPKLEIFFFESETHPLCSVEVSID